MNRTLEDDFEDCERQRRLRNVDRRSGSSNDDDDDGSSSRSRSSIERFESVNAAAQLLSSTVQNYFVDQKTSTILRALDDFVDNTKDAIETNTIREKKVDREIDNKEEWTRRFGIEPAMNKAKDETTNDEKKITRAMNMLENSSSSDSSSLMTDKTKTNNKEENDHGSYMHDDDVEQAIEKNVLKKVDDAIRDLEVAATAIVNSRQRSNEVDAGGFVTYFSSLALWQKRIVGVLLVIVFACAIVVTHIENDEQPEFAEIDSTIATSKISE